MDKLNEIYVDTPRGIRSVDLYCGDITEPPRNIDLLVFSSFEDSYLPTPGTVIGSLEKRYGLDIAAIAQAPQIDLREPLGCWISKVLSRRPFRRIMCVTGGKFHSKTSVNHQAIEKVRNCFRAVAVLEAWDDKCASMMMPVLGAGQQGFEVSKVIPLLVETATDILMRSVGLEHVALVEIDRKKAEALSVGLDESLGRQRIVLGNQSVANATRKTLTDEIAALKSHNLSATDVALLDELSRILRTEMTFVQLGHWCRRFVEILVFDVIGAQRFRPERTRVDLLHAIRASEFQRPTWITGYMHSLRKAGNEAVHVERVEQNRRRLRHRDQIDMVILLLMAAQLMRYWRMQHQGMRSR